MIMENYVAGFMFTEDKKHVVLIQKNKPSWQRGKLNGVGGKIEPGETPSEAMVREFFEETGVTTSSCNWTNIARIASETKSNIYVFSCFNDDALSSRTMEKEVVYILKVNEIPDNIIGNIKWLIHMALDEKLNYPINVDEKCRR